MEIKKFRNKYDLELISAATSDLHVGTLVWDPLFGKPKFERPGGMPDNIFNAILDTELINRESWEEYLKACKDIKMVDAELANRVIDVDVSSVSSFENPKIGSIKGSFDFQSIKKFEFGDIKARKMTNLLRISIDNYLDELRKNEWEDYDGKIRRVFMITELYYGDVKIVIDNEFKVEFEAALENADMELKNETKVEKMTEFTFDHQNVPFAMRIEKVRTFQG